MGSCISKFGPKRTKKFKKECCEDYSHVHDKLVISQDSVPAAPHPLQKLASRLPSASSDASISSFSNSTSTGFSITSSLSSSSSCSSSVSITKDRSFSSEFLRSCVKENPHIIGRNSTKGSLENSGPPTKTNTQNFDLLPSTEKPRAPAVKQAFEETHRGSIPKKRIRENSPTIIRQKSFRKEPDRENSMYVPSRTLRSPSPSRVFNAEPNRTPSRLFSAEPSRTLRSPSPSRRVSGDQSFKNSFMTAKMENYSRKGVISKGSLGNPQSCRLKKQSIRASGGNQINNLKSTRDMGSPQVRSRMDECEAEEEEKQHEHEDVEMMAEDINNPRIALDCFIFL